MKKLLFLICFLSVAHTEIITWTPQGGGVEMNGTINGIAVETLDLITLELLDGTLASADGEIDIAGFVSLTVTFNGVDFVHDIVPNRLSNVALGLSDSTTFAWFQTGVGGATAFQNLLAGESVNALNGQTADGGTGVGLVAVNNVTFNGGIDIVTQQININAASNNTIFDIAVDGVGAVPEPSTYILMSLLGLFSFIRYKKKK